MIDADQYMTIFGDYLLPSLKELGIPLKDTIFQQNNNPKHTSKKAQKQFKNNNINVLGQALQSPDLNLIEHLWKHIKWQLDKAKRGLGDLGEGSRGMEQYFTKGISEFD